MTKWILAAGAAALAITTPALADRGGHGGGQGGQQAAKAEKGGGSHARAAKADRGGGNRSAKADRGGGNRIAKADKGGGHRSIQQFADRGSGKKQAHATRMSGFDDRGKNHGNLKVQGRNIDRAVVSSRGHDELRVRGARIDDNRFDRRFAGNGLIDGCPPGLAKKNNGSLPPGQAKKLLNTRLNVAYQRSFLPASFRNWYPDSNDYYYREVNGYAYRVDRNRGLIDGLFPLFNNDGNYFSVGQPYPLDYGFYNVPMQYQSYYPDSNDYYYRYGDGGIYQVNRSNGLIEGIAALLTGGFGVGQRMPMGYDAYNVPYAYRDRYYDTADNWYRYNDGYIYRVDPQTQLIQAVISALI